MKKLMRQEHPFFTRPLIFFGPQQCEDIQENDTVFDFLHTPLHDNMQNKIHEKTGLFVLFSESISDQEIHFS